MALCGATGTTKIETQQKLNAKLAELRQGVRSSGDYTVTPVIRTGATVMGALMSTVRND